MSLLALGCLPTDTADPTVASRASWEILGANQSRAGEALFNLGDVDGDGADNLAVAVETDPNGGHPILHILRGDETSLTQAWGRIDLGAEGQWPVGASTIAWPDGGGSPSSWRKMVKDRPSVESRADAGHHELAGRGRPCPLDFSSPEDSASLMAMRNKPLMSCRMR